MKRGIYDMGTDNSISVEMAEGRIIIEGDNGIRAEITPTTARIIAESLLTAAVLLERAGIK